MNTERVVAFVSLGLVLAIAISVYLYRSGIGVSYREFQPPHCEFLAEIAGEPEFKEHLRGELTLTTATVVHADGTQVRASCTPLLVVDREAFDAQLREQVEFAARSIGVTDAEVDIRRQGDHTVASYWGLRGTQGKFLRSDTYIGSKSFMEVLVLMPGSSASGADSERLIRVSGG